jgi:hypothetical protein
MHQCLYRVSVSPRRGGGGRGKEREREREREGREGGGNTF